MCLFRPLFNLCYAFQQELHRKFREKLLSSKNLHDLFVQCKIPRTQYAKSISLKLTHALFTYFGAKFAGL